MADYSDNPVYQRALARRLSTAPNVQAVVSTSDIDAAAAKEAQGRDLEAQKVKSQLGFAEQRLAQQTAEFDSRMALNRERLSMDRQALSDAQRQGQLASVISGAGAVVGGLKGYRDVQTAKATARAQENINKGILNQAQQTTELYRELSESFGRQLTASEANTAAILNAMLDEILPISGPPTPLNANEVGIGNQYGGGNVSGQGNMEPPPATMPDIYATPSAQSGLPSYKRRYM